MLQVGRAVFFSRYGQDWWQSCSVARCANMHARSCAHVRELLACSCASCSVRTRVYMSARVSIRLRIRICAYLRVRARACSYSCVHVHMCALCAHARMRASPLPFPPLCCAPLRFQAPQSPHVRLASAPRRFPSACTRLLPSLKPPPLHLPLRPFPPSACNCGPAPAGRDGHGRVHRAV
jgi:hypothetical protein